jgi:hypothetical protein
MPNPRISGGDGDGEVQDPERVSGSVKPTGFLAQVVGRSIGVVALRPDGGHDHSEFSEARCCGLVIP